MSPAQVTGHKKAAITREMHDRVVWSYWARLAAAGEIATYEAAVPNGRADLLRFRDRHTPCEVIEVKLREEIWGVRQVAGYRSALATLGFAVSATLVATPTRVSEILRTKAEEADVRIEIVSPAEILVRPPYRGRMRMDPDWPAGGWSGYWDWRAA